MRKIGKFRSFDFGDFEITKREILASISIIAVMLLIGVLIASKISEYQMDKNEIYNKALKIESQDLFQYGMETNAGNAFVYGDLLAVDTVSYPELAGKYMYIKKVKEKYTEHTRQVRHSNGKTTWYTTETYWTWDYVSSERKKCQSITFCGVLLDSSKIRLPDTEYIDTLYESSSVRYVYRGVGSKFTGTIFAQLKNGTIPDQSPFYQNRTINETVDYLESGVGIIVFWIIWIFLIIACVFGFYYLENAWLE